MSAPGGSVIRVVVVDDHPIVRDGLIGIFSREDDLEVVGEASDGREALVVIDRTAPDVVIMDLRMPGGDGVTAIREFAEARGQGAHPRADHL